MLTELEMAALGVVSLYQPCSGYGIRKVFERSLSSHWRGSSGAIYPLLRRLERQRLVQSVARDGDGRSTRAYRLTRTGKAELVNWLKPPLPDAGELVTMDPLRMRIRFLQVLTRTDRLALVREARTKLKLHIKSISSAAREDKTRGDTFRYLSHRSAVYSMRGQLAWLDEVEQML